MSSPSNRRHRAPRLFVKMLGVSFAVIASVLAAVFLPLTWQARQRLEDATVQNLETSQLRFAELEQRDQTTQLAQAKMLAENPTLKAAIDAYHADRHQAADVGRLVNGLNAAGVSFAPGEPVATPGPPPRRPPNPRGPPP